MHYVTLYDISEHNPIPFLLFVVILYLFIVIVAVRAAKDHRLFQLLSTPNALSWMIVLAGGLFATIIVTERLVIAAVYFRTLAQGQYRIVEGPVEEFIPRPIGGHGVARFSVNGVMFTYVATDITGALQQPQPPRQALQTGSYVRISYTRDYDTVYVAEPTLYDPKILKVEMLQQSEPPTVARSSNQISCVTPIAQQPNPRLQPTALPCVQDRPFFNGNWPDLPTSLPQGGG